MFGPFFCGHAGGLYEKNSLSVLVLGGSSPYKQVDVPDYIRSAARSYIVEFKRTGLSCDKGLHRGVEDFIELGRAAAQYIVPAITAIAEISTGHAAQGGPVLRPTFRKVGAVGKVGVHVKITFNLERGFRGRNFMHAETSENEQTYRGK